MQDDNPTTSVCRRSALRRSLGSIWSNCRSSYLVFLCVWSCKNLIRRTHYVKKIRFKVKCVYFSPGNALGPTDRFAPDENFMMRTGYLFSECCGLECISSPPLLSQLAAVCARACAVACISSVLCLCALHAYLCVIGLSEMEKAGWGLSWAGWRGGRGCLHSGKTSRGFPLRALAFLSGEASRPPPFRRAGGHSSRRNTSKKTRGVEGLPQFSAVAPSGVSQQRRVRELVGAPERPSLCHVASRGMEVFVQRANGGREETREAQQGVFAFARACSVCQVGLRKTFSQAHQQQKTKQKTNLNCKLGFRYLSARLIRRQFLGLTTFFFLSFPHHPTDIDPPWLRPCCSTGTCLPLLSSLLPSCCSFGIRQFSCSLPQGLAGQRRAHVRPHAHTRMRLSRQRRSSVDLPTHLRLLRTGAAAIWRSCQMSRRLTKGRISTRRKTSCRLFAKELQFGIAQRVVVDKKNRKKQGVC